MANDIKLTAAQERILREAELACQFNAFGADFATCERLRRAGLVRLVSYRVYRVTHDGRAWLAANQEKAKL